MRTKLLVCDFDGTVTQGDVLDMLCGLAGATAQSEEINSRYIAGEIDGATALRQRFRLMEGISWSAIEKMLSQVALDPGAKALFSFARAQGVEILMLSGNLDFVVEHFRQELGFDRCICSHLPIVDGKLGSAEDERTRLVNKQADLRAYMKQQGLTADEVIAVGDSVSDFPVFNEVGKAFGIHWKGARRADVQEVETLEQIIGYMV